MIWSIRLSCSAIGTNSLYFTPRLVAASTGETDFAKKTIATAEQLQALVLGAQVRSDGSPSAMLEDRVRAAALEPELGPQTREHGDLLCRVVVETPVKLTEHQRKLLKELDDAGIRFKDLHTTQSSLEDIFVNLVREDA